MKREKESQLKEIAGTCEKSSQELAWKDLSRGEKIIEGLLYTNVVVAPIVNAAIYASIMGAGIYYVATR